MRSVLLGSALLLASLGAGCGGYAYVFRSPVHEPLAGVRRVGVHLEAVTPRGQERLAARLTSREDALIAWLGREGRAASFVAIEGGDEATVHVLLTAEPPRVRPEPRAVSTESLRIGVRITVERGAERVAIVEGTASTPFVTFHGLIDPDLPLVFERLAHRLSRVLAELGLR